MSLSIYLNRGFARLPVRHSNFIHQPACATFMEISIVCLPASPSVGLCVCMFFFVGVEGAEHTLIEHRHTPTHDPHSRTEITHVVLGRVIVNAPSDGG